MKPRPVAMALALFGSLAGCSGYFAPDFRSFKAEILADYPVGSPVAALEKDQRLRAFSWSGPAFNPNAPDYEESERCLRRQLAFGFWGGGYRMVCVQSNAGRIERIAVHEQVAGI